MKNVLTDQADVTVKHDCRKFLLAGAIVTAASLLPQVAFAAQPNQPQNRVDEVGVNDGEPHQKKSENYSATQQALISLSQQKWRWMADKNVRPLADLFDDASVFVHMGGTWGKEQELKVIESGNIHYKKADIHKTSVNIINDTAILLSHITLLAVVGGNEVTNNFMVTEVYVEKENGWKIGSLSFTKLNY